MNSEIITRAGEAVRICTTYYGMDLTAAALNVSMNVNTKCKYAAIIAEGEYLIPSAKQNKALSYNDIQLYIKP